MQTPRRSFPIWSLFIFAGVAAMIARLYTSIEGEVTPQAVIPTAVLPRHNAFDDIVQAGNMLGKGHDIDDALDSDLSVGSAYSLAAQEAVVRKHDAALALVRSSFAFPYVTPSQRSFDALMPYFSKERRLARLFRVDAQVKAAHGNWTGAMEADLDTIQLGEEIPHGAIVIGALVGTACQAVGRRPLWSTVPHLTAPQASAAAQRLEAIAQLHTPLSDTMQQEEWFGQASLLKMFHTPDWRGVITDQIMAMQEGKPRWAIRLRLDGVSKRTIWTRYTTVMDQMVRDAKRSYAAKSPPSALLDDPLISWMVFPYQTIQLKDSQNETQDALLAATLALHAYRLEQHALPKTLQALVPAYLKHVPDDPFALSGPLQYHLHEQSFVLYSIGPDGKDDGGTAIFDADKPAPSAPDRPDFRRYISAESHGDIVAGVNLF